ncbi:MAG: NTP transferase domain-containing protein [Gemmatimonadetes bacterium]|nr:NTP transferase domain-containing protein [Gemmatimonadota bacterium]
MDFGPILKAVIPAGGLGTRLRPVTYGIPKEMLPVHLRPMLEYAVAEAALSGIHDICLVLAPEKEDSVRRYFEAVPPQGCSLEYVFQPRPLGLMDAVRRAADFIGGDRVAVLLPDNLFVGHPPALRQLLTVWRRFGTNVVGLVRVGAEEAMALGPRGPIRAEAVEGGVYRIQAFQAKAPVRVAAEERHLVSVGRYAFAPGVVDAIRSVAPSVAEGGAARRGLELDDVPVLQRLVAEEALLGAVLEGEYYDVGNPVGYWRANLRFSPGEELAAKIVLASRGREG